MGRQGDDDTVDRKRLSQKIGALQILQPGTGCWQSENVDSAGLLMATYSCPEFSSEFGLSSLHLAAFALACAGGKPKWLQVSAHLPPAAGGELVTNIHHFCSLVEVSLVHLDVQKRKDLRGGIMTSTMIGTPKGGLLPGERTCRGGDELLIIGHAALAGALIIAERCAGQLRRMYDEEFVAHCRRLDFPSVRETMRRIRFLWRHAAFRRLLPLGIAGLAGALYGLAEESECGFIIHDENIGWLPETKLLCDQYEIDPFGTFSEGALLMAAPPGGGEAALKALREKGVHATAVGSLVPQAHRKELMRAGERVPFPRFSGDELAKVLPELG